MTKRTEHTPGPWRIGDAGNTIFGPPYGLPPERIADLSRTRNRAGNAPLLKAAPALLEAAEAVAEWLEDRPSVASGCEVDPAEEKALAVLRTAIAAARGESRRTRSRAQGAQGRVR